MVVKVRFCLLESSRSIARASLSVMILKSSFLHSLLQLGHVLRGEQHHILCQLSGHFGLYCMLKLSFLLRSKSEKYNYTKVWVVK